MQAIASPDTAVRPRSWRQFLRRGLAAVLPWRWYIVRGPVHGGSVCLTFDDGPDPEHTPRLLDVLGRYRVPATFFVIGEKAQRHPEIVRRIAAEGHVVGHHSFHHTEPMRTSARQLLAEVRQTRELLGTLLDEPPSLFRPPYGALTWAKLWGLWRAGQTVVLWSVDPKDYACGSADEVRDRLRRQPPRSGDVILMHDNRPYAADVVADLVADVTRQGLTFGTPTAWTKS
jgi:peptidoglycan/xylan/chitin deacetylase (PgdA/CDA1 family)